MLTKKIDTALLNIDTVLGEKTITMFHYQYFLPPLLANNHFSLIKIQKQLKLSYFLFITSNQPQNSLIQN